MVNPNLNSSGHSTFVSTVTFSVLASVAVGLRIFARLRYGIKLGLDDWLIVASLPFYYLFSGIALFGVFTLGGGQTYTDPAELSYNLSRYLKSEYFVPPSYILAITLIKFSIIAFYRRIFTVGFYKTASLVVGVLCFILFSTTFIASLLYCRPMHGFWDLTGNVKCFNFGLFFVINETLDMALQIAIMALPIRIIMTLHLPVHKKVTLIAIFLMGGFVLVTGILQIVLVYQPHEALISFTKAALWTDIHLGVSIICACMPTYGPLWPSIVSIGSTLRSLITRTSTTSASQTNTAPSSGASNYKKMAYSESEGDHIHLTTVSAGKNQHSGIEGIRVERDFNIA